MKSNSARHVAFAASVAIGLSACIGSTGQTDGPTAVRSVEPATAASIADGPEPAQGAEDESDRNSATDYLLDREDRSSTMARVIELAGEAMRASAGEQSAAVLSEASLAADDLASLFEDRTPPDGFTESHDPLIASWRLMAQSFESSARGFRVVDDGPAFRAELRRSEELMLEAQRLRQASDRALP